MRKFTSVWINFENNLSENVNKVKAQVISANRWIGLNVWNRLCARNMEKGI